MLIPKVISVLITFSGFLPDRDSLIYNSPISIPNAITKLYPLPQQEMTLSYSRGQSYLASGRFQQALIEFQRCIDIKPDNVEFYYSKGIAEEKLFLWDEAINDYRKAIDLNKKIIFARDDPYLFNNLANAEVGRQDYTNALEHFSYASKLDASFEAPALGRALVLYEVGKEDESLKYFTALHEKYPNYSDGNAALAVMTHNVDLWNDVIKNDERYGDLDWITNVRRWPPKLIISLQKFIPTIKMT